MSESLKPHFSRLTAALGDRLHFAAHARSPQPDVARDAVLECWDDSAREGGAWWRKVWGDVLPLARRNAAAVLRLADPELIAVAPTAHELLARLLTCLPFGRDLRVLTTESEPRASARQIARLEEDGARVERLLVEPFGTFADRLLSALKAGSHDLILLSQVFADSGLRASDELLAAAAELAPRGALFIVDGGLAFGSVPTDFSRASARAFYLAGAARGAQSGEGLAFLAVPPECPLRPADTGGLADPDGLARAVCAPVAYGAGGARFMGGAFDAAALYRWNAVCAWRRSRRLGPREIDARLRGLQSNFVRRLAERPRGPLDVERLVSMDLASLGHFLVLRHPEAERLAGFMREELGVLVDHLGDRLRFGFGLHLDDGDIEELFRRLDSVHA